MGEALHSRRERDIFSQSGDFDKTVAGGLAAFSFVIAVVALSCESGKRFLGGAV